MTLTARWPRLPLPMRALIVVVGVLAFLLDSTVLALVMAGMLIAHALAGLKIRAEGAGYRPLRTADLLEFAAADELDAFDRERAIQEAQMKARMR